ncbi:Ficolin-1-A [Lamellibrachia satsuma]|nr:Ficolin-1-A [Lamellibrachia satsuma]
MHTIDRSGILLYDRTSTCMDIDKIRKKLFAMKNNVHLIPPTKADALERQERKHQHYQDSLEQLEIQHQDSMEQLWQHFNDSMKLQQTRLMTLRETVAKQEEDLRELVKCASACTTPTPSATDCADLLAEGHSASGVYDIRLTPTNKTIKVYCDMRTDGGGWLVFQRRQDGTVDFSRDWNSYKEGFGNASGEFWLGNDNLHAVTAQKEYTLRIDLGDFEGATRYALYPNFTVASESDNFTLYHGLYSGTAGSSFRWHHGMPFSTRDRDNDANENSCAEFFGGGWWYHKNCYSSNLNGPYFHDPHATQDRGGVHWGAWRGFDYSLKTVEMKLRP